MSQFSLNNTFFEIPETDTIWILSPGASLDLFDGKRIKVFDIVITLNSAISYWLTPDYQIGYDIAAIMHYSKYSDNNTLWITRDDTQEIANKEKINHINIDNLISDRVKKGAGAESFYFCAYLTHYQPSIKKINYVGFDFCNTYIGNRKQEYRYCSKVELLESQLQLQLPGGWMNRNPKHRFTTYNSYKAQLTYITKMYEIMRLKGIEFNSYSLSDLSTIQPGHGNYQYMKKS